MNYALESTTYEFELKNPGFITSHEEEEMLIKKATAILFSQNTQFEVEKYPYINDEFEIIRNVSSSGSKFQISKNQTRERELEKYFKNKKPKTQKDVFYREKALIKNKKHPIGKFMYKEFLKDKATGNLPIEHGKTKSESSGKDNVFKTTLNVSKMRECKLPKYMPKKKFKLTGELKNSNFTTQSFGEPSEKFRIN